MVQKSLFMLSAVSLLGAVSGCGVLDCVKDVPDRCPVHGEKMTIKTLEISPGYIGYLPEYSQIMAKDFPYYDGTRWDHAAYHFGYRRMKTYVCDTCTRAYNDYHCKQKQKQASRDGN